ncbi:hypothetical protein ELY33_11395 [Vreelandella andesensis]|uniref:DUF6436 domain-containing protein n=1 Tax=Vreelandella andesensis TaxID=447567 RepID=A0A433KLJ1_9GAMM|nr:DUF6436 domain-containing protein [Halomonas andesensis]RUR30389.1 hypothetical protein ELY33_11395 [Halomonas andesensis]
MGLSGRKKQIWLGALVGTWALGIAYVFWLFMFKDLRVFADEPESLAKFSQAVAEQVSKQVPVQNVPKRESTQLVIMWDPACSCSRFSEGHVNDIIDIYSPSGIEFIVATPSEEALALATSTFPEVTNAIAVEGISGISSPSAVIIDESGNVMYSGPFSDGALCNADGDSPVEIMLDEMNEKESVSPWLNISSFGCYCDWPR